MGQIPEIHNGLSPTIKHNIISSNSAITFWIQLLKLYITDLEYLFNKLSLVFIGGLFGVSLWNVCFNYSRELIYISCVLASFQHFYSL